MGESVQDGCARTVMVPDLLFDASDCLALNRPAGSCSLCSDACPKDAVSIAGRSITIDHDLCVVCGQCVPACPGGALSLGQALALEAPSPAIECARVPESARRAGADIVTCLAGLTPDALRMVLADGDVTLVDHGWCNGCALGPTSKVEALAVTVNAEAEALHLEGRIVVEAVTADTIEPLPPPQSPAEKRKAMSRRNLFRRAAGQRDEWGKTAFDFTEAPLRHIAAVKLDNRLTSIQALAGGVSVPAGLFPSVEREGVIHIRMAAQLCPTRALRLAEQDDAETLTFDAARCIACGDCAAAGLKLLPAGEGEYYGPAVLHAAAAAVCTRCDARFERSGSEAICGNCRKDTELAAFAHGLMRRPQVQRGV